MSDHDAADMTTSKPYLLRAMYEWIVDNGCTPYVVVDAEVSGVQVPQQYIQDGKIILNISMSATQQLVMKNDWIEFQARFSGVLNQIYAPMQAIVAIYARENGRGMVFGEEEDDQTGTPPDDPNSPPDKPTGKPNLTVVK